MKITIVQGAFLPVPPLLGGAVEKVWQALGREFARRGHAVTHFSRCHPGLPERETISGVTHRRVRGADFPRSLVYLKWLDLLYSLRIRRRLPDADIMVTNTFWLPMLACPRAAGKIYVHVARYPKGQLRFYGHAARLHTVSEAVAAAMRAEAPHLAEKVRVIPYPLTDAPDTSAGTTKRREILFAGRLHPEKGLELLIKAFALLPTTGPAPWRLRLAGPWETAQGGGGPAYLAKLRQLAAPVADRIDWLGPIFDPAELSRTYATATLFVYPSLAETGETFGMAPLEAMAHGCVPVVSALACFRDYLRPENGRVFDHRAARPEQALADALAALIADPAAVGTLSAAARQEAEAHSLERIAGWHLEDFATLCRGG